MEKTPGVRKIVQIAHVVKDIDKSMKKFTGIFIVGENQKVQVVNSTTTWLNLRQNEQSIRKARVQFD